MSLFPKAVFVKGEAADDEALTKAIQSGDYYILKEILNQKFNIDLDSSQLHLCNDGSDKDLVTVIITHDWDKFKSITVGGDYLRDIGDFLKP